MSCKVYARTSRVSMEMPPAAPNVLLFLIYRNAHKRCTYSLSTGFAQMHP